MKVANRAYLTDETVAAYTSDKPQSILWDTELKGFGCRLSIRTGAKTFILQARDQNRKENQHTLGRFRDPYTTEEARAKAIELKKQLKGETARPLAPVLTSKVPWATAVKPVSLAPMPPTLAVHTPAEALVYRIEPVLEDRESIIGALSAYAEVLSAQVDDDPDDAELRYRKALTEEMASILKEAFSLAAKKLKRKQKREMQQAQPKVRKLTLNEKHYRDGGILVHEGKPGEYFDGPVWQFGDQRVALREQRKNMTPDELAVAVEESFALLQSKQKAS